MLHGICYMEHVTKNGENGEMRQETCRFNYGKKQQWLPGYIEGHWPLVYFQGTTDFPCRPGAKANLNWEV